MLTKPLFIPYIDSREKDCLTAANWQALGIMTLSYDLGLLLQKSDWLCLNLSLKQFFNCSQDLIINAELKQNKSGDYFIKSLLDGKTKVFKVSELIALLIQLSPDYLIIPPSLSVYKTQLEDNKINTLIQGKVYQSYKENLENFEQTNILGGNYGLRTLIKYHDKYPKLSFESSKALDEALKRRFYRDNQIIALDEKTANTHQVLDETCRCPVCKNKLTQAYLTHLIEHTPLLAQRYLIQHNNYFCQAWLNRKT